MRKSKISKIEYRFRWGFSLIDVIIAIGVIVLLFGGIYLVYISILDVLVNLEARSAATAVLNERMEVIRNIPFDDLGVQGGIPSGVISPQQTLSFGSYEFLVRTTVRNIDDPFDGTLGGNPNDTAPADYKLVEMEVSCPLCTKFVPLIFTAMVAPKNLESASANGSLFVNVFNASGEGVDDATVHVVNSSVSPSIDLTDATNQSGVLQLVGVPTSTQSYEVTVSKSGYSTGQTYPTGDPENPNPVTPHATVAAQTVTSLSFAIDLLSDFEVKTLNKFCGAVGEVDFSMSGLKKIGTNPDVLKFSTTSQTNSSGDKYFTGIEWDTYSLLMTDNAFDILGTEPISDVVVNPNTTGTFSFFLQDANPRSLFLTVKDSVSKAGVLGASVNLSTIGFSESLVGGRAFFGETDWSSGNYYTQSGGLDLEDYPGEARILEIAPSVYPTGTLAWFISNTFDVGGASSSFYSINWTPVSQPPQAGTASLKFQLASNNDNSSWSFVGPDGTAATYYTNPSSTIWGGHNGHRYLKYKAYFSTLDANYTPVLQDVSFEFSGPCVPPSQFLFTELGLGDYDFIVNAPGYEVASGTISVTGDWQQAEVLMLAQ